MSTLRWLLGTVPQLRHCKTTAFSILVVEDEDNFVCERETRSGVHYLTIYNGFYGLDITKKKNKIFESIRSNVVVMIHPMVFISTIYFISFD